MIVKGSNNTNEYRSFLNIHDMISMEIAAGSPIIIETGNESTVTVAWPSISVVLGDVHLSSLIRETLNCDLESQVTISKSVSFQEGLNIQLIALTSDSSLPPLPLIKQTIVNAKFISTVTKIIVKFKEKSYFFKVVSINNSSANIIARVSKLTLVTLSKQEKSKNTNSGYHKIGGLQEQIKQVRQMIELPLKNPDLYLKLGLKPPKGVLLFGPPGTGKTLIARAVAYETNVHVSIINGGEIVSKYYGETEAKLREVFSEASLKSPSIIFIDEMDALCPKRDDSSNEMEKRVVATLLTLMDGIDSNVAGNGSVMVIGATNRPHAIDQALRRPGRFDKEIEIGIPDIKARREIFKVLLESVPHNITESELDLIASSTHGYVGADISGLLHEAGLEVIQRLTPSVEVIQQMATLQISNSSPNSLSNFKLFDTDQLTITFKDIKRAKLKIKPSVMREIALEIPSVKWTDIGGQNEIKEKLIQAIQWPLQHPEAFEKLGINPPKGILLYGPPGCSKTLLAKALATESGVNFLAVKGPEIFNKWVGESERAIKEIFRKARAASPSIIFFDEIDAIASTRSGFDGNKGDSGTSSVSDRVLTQLLTEMDGVEPLVNVTIVAATNRPDTIDPALMRPGRLDRILYVSPPDREARESILKSRTSKMPLHNNISLYDLSIKTEGMSGAEVVAIVQEAAIYAMKKDPENVQTIELKHFEYALENLKPRISETLIEFYKTFGKNSNSRNL